VKSVPRAVRSKSLFAALSVLLMIAATLFGANVGQASSTTAVTKQSLKTCVNTVSGSVYLRTGRLCNSKTGTTVKWFRSVKPTAGKTVVTLVSCVNKKTRSTRLARSTRCKPRTEKKVVWSRLVTTPVESEVVGQDPSATEPAAASVPVINSLRQTSATTIEVSFSMTSTRTTTRDGGVTTYTVTASTSSGERSATGTTSPITVTGLTQYTAYTFIVTATGADGSRRSSETSPPVTTPYAPVPTPPTPASPVVTPQVYNIGDIGPGGGLVFLISGGLTYEMAPKTWSGSSSDDTPSLAWCSDTSTSIAGAVGTAVGTGSANTTAMLALPCTSGAAFSADAYAGGGFTDWFLPSKDELRAMCRYSRNPTTPPTGACTGSQDGTFSTGTYGFASGIYWSSSQYDAATAWYQYMDIAPDPIDAKSTTLRVRPVRAF